MEHFDIGDNGSLLLVGQTNDFDRLVLLDNATLDTTGSNGATTGDGEDVLNGHQEGHVSLAVRGRNPGVDSLHELFNALVLGSIRVGGLGSQRVQSGAADDGGVVAGEAVEVEGLADFHLDELEELFVVDLVALVQEDQNGRNVNLTGKQQMLLGLSHRTIGSSDNQDSAVHLSSTGDHVLDIVGVTRAVDVGVVTTLDLNAVFAGLVVVANTVVGLILDVRSVDGDTTLALFRSLIDGRVVGVLGIAEESKVLGDSSRQSGLAMVDVTDGTNVDMGLILNKMLFCHLDESSLVNSLTFGIAFFTSSPSYTTNADLTRRFCKKHRRKSAEFQYPLRLETTASVSALLSST